MNWLENLYEKIILKIDTFLNILNKRDKYFRHAIHFNRHIDISEEKPSYPYFYLQYRNTKLSHTVQW